jgi:hypothetical protein
LFRGKQPRDIEEEVWLQLGFKGNVSLPQKWSQNNMTSDPIKRLTVALYFVLVILSLIMFYSKKKKIIRWKRRLRNLIWPNNVSPTISDEPTSLSEKFTEKKSMIFGAGQMVLVIFLGMLFVFPITFARASARNSYEEINRSGRVWIYLSKVSMPSFYYLVFPCFIILSNNQLRESLLRNFQESWLWMKVLSFYRLITSRDNVIEIFE